MKKIIVLSVACLFATISFAQKSAKSASVKKKAVTAVAAKKAVAERNDVTPQATMISTADGRTADKVEAVQVDAASATNDLSSKQAMMKKAAAKQVVTPDAKVKPVLAPKAAKSDQ